MSPEAPVLGKRDFLRTATTGGVVVVAVMAGTDATGASGADGATGAAGLAAGVIVAFKTESNTCPTTSAPT